MDYKLHNQSTKRSANPYADNYTGFIWNGHHSSDFNCFIENTGHLTFEPAPDFSNSTVSPAFYDGALYTGVQTQSKKIQLNLVFYHVTLNDFNRALHWLDRKVVSGFLLDYNPNWRYQCKLSSIGVTEKYVDGYCINSQHGSYQKQDLYICRMQVDFETVDIHNAISTYGYMSHYPTTSVVTHTDTEQITITYYEKDEQYVFYNLHWVESMESSLPNATQLVIGDIVFELQSGVQLLTADLGDKQLKLKCDVEDNGFYIDGEEQSWVIAEDEEGGEISATLIRKYTETVINPIPAMITLNNPYYTPIPFRIHLSNFTTKQLVIYKLNPDDYQPSEQSRTPICSLDLNLDAQQRVSLHYDSNTGAVTMVGQLINSLRNGNGDLLCNYCSTVANLMIPAQSEIYLSIPDFDGEVTFDFDYQTSII